MTSLSERTQTKELWTICRYFQLVFQNFGTLFIYVRYYFTLNNLTKTRYGIQYKGGSNCMYDL